VIEILGLKGGACPAGVVRTPEILDVRRDKLRVAGITRGADLRVVARRNHEQRGNDDASDHGAVDGRVTGRASLSCTISATNRATALGFRSNLTVAVGAWLEIAFISNGRLSQRYFNSQSQKSTRSRDRLTARHAHRRNEKSRKMIVSAARSRTSMAS
jgi:hypothetical protein